MRIFALETDLHALKRRFLTEGEEEVMTVFYHGMSFFFATLRQTIFTMGIFFVGFVLIAVGFPPIPVSATLAFLWFFFVFFNLLKAYIDWYYDFILVTTDKVVLVDQSSIFRQKITPINMENFASVSAETQYWGLFGFGIVHFNLKEGPGAEIKLAYIPNAHEVAACVSGCVTTFQRRRFRSWNYAAA